MHTVVETVYYARRAEKLLSQGERDEVIRLIAFDPLRGDLIESTGGLRKVRFAKGNRGKSGGVRVLYYYYDIHAPTLLLDIFGKNEKDNLSKAERNALAQVVSEIKRQRRGRLQ